jgi:hypothetical protein
VGRISEVGLKVQMCKQWLFVALPVIALSANGKYAAALGVHSLQELRRLPATRLLGGGNAGGVTHPVIEPYLLPMVPIGAHDSPLNAVLRCGASLQL